MLRFEKYTDESGLHCFELKYVKGQTVACSNGGWARKKYRNRALKKMRREMRRMRGKTFIVDND